MADAFAPAAGIDLKATANFVPVRTFDFSTADLRPLRGCSWHATLSPRRKPGATFFGPLRRTRAEDPIRLPVSE